LPKIGIFTHTLATDMLAGQSRAL